MLDTKLSMMLELITSLIQAGHTMHDAINMAHRILDNHTS